MIKIKKVVKIECNTCKHSREHANELYCAIKMKDDADRSSSSRVTTVVECSYFKLK